MENVETVFEEIHLKIIDSLIPFYGNNRAEVVRTLTIHWIGEHIADEKIKELQKIGAINQCKK